MRWAFNSRKKTDIESFPDQKTDAGHSMTRVFLGGFLEGFGFGGLFFRPKDRRTRIGLESFLDGFTGAGLFGKLRRPGAPTEFIDSRSVEEYRDSGEFEETLRRHGYDVPGHDDKLKRS